MRRKSKREVSEVRSGSGMIEQQIQIIFGDIVSKLPHHLEARRAKPAKGSSLCKGIIQIFHKDEFRKASAEKRKCYPRTTYAFYVKNFQEFQLESVAIYGEGIPAIYYTLVRRGILFGYRIVSLQLNVGLHPFLDVKLAV